MNNLRDLLDRLTMENCFNSPKQRVNRPANVVRIAIDDFIVESQQLALEYLIENGCNRLLALQLASNFVHNHLLVEADKLKRECKKTDSDLDPSKLTGLVIPKLISYCQSLDKDTTFSMLNYSSIFEDSICAVRNTRRKMEDRHLSIPQLSLVLPETNELSKLALYGLFDGHGGAECAQFAVCHLVESLLHQSAEQISLSNCQRLQLALDRIDSLFCARATSHNLQCGATALCALVDAQSISLAWLGDSQAALISSTMNEGRFSCKILTRAHCTSDSNECSMIIENGGMIIDVNGQMRVNAVLCVTRSLGDTYVKPPLSSNAETICIPIKNDNHCLVLACDGLWDTVSTDKVAILYEHYLKDVHSSNDGASLSFSRILTQEAKESGSQDNITVVVVFLKK